ncbi:MAG: hypothetical protein ABI867_31425 [Kofleriaceae bacterium]
MTRTEARLVLAQRQRRFEWELARDEQTRAAARMVAGRTHDLLNLIQIVQLATLQLDTMCGSDGKEFIDDLLRAADDSQRSMTELMEAARPEVAITRGDPVGAAVDAALATLRPALAVDIHLALSADTCTRCSARELEHLLIGLVLDVCDEVDHIELFVRERRIGDHPWIEIVRSTDHAPEGDRFELRAVTAIAERAGGELATSERRGGGAELVVALPVV